MEIKEMNQNKSEIMIRKFTQEDAKKEGRKEVLGRNSHMRDPELLMTR